MQKYLRIATVAVTCLVVGYFSGLVTRESIITWYPTLVKPVFNPPNWIFAPVWSMLYIMMGIAAGIVWNRSDFEKTFGSLPSCLLKYFRCLYHKSCPR